MIKSLTEMVSSWFQWFFDLFAGRARTSEEITDSPEELVYLAPTEDPEPALSRHRFVVVGTEEHPKWLLFTCPCGCQQQVRLNLMERFSPRWRIVRTEQGLTVHPSVDMTTCGAHFWLRDSAVVWAGSSTGPAA